MVFRIFSVLIILFSFYRRIKGALWFFPTPWGTIFVNFIFIAIVLRFFILKLKMICYRSAVWGFWGPCYLYCPAYYIFLVFIPLPHYHGQFPLEFHPRFLNPDPHNLLLRLPPRLLGPPLQRPFDSSSSET